MFALILLLLVLPLTLYLANVSCARLINKQVFNLFIYYYIIIIILTELLLWLLLYKLYKFSFCLQYFVVTSCFFLVLTL
jgi:hypothetical protein